MKTLEEVKQYFKDAIKVRDYKGDIGFVELEKIKENKGCFTQNAFEDNWIVLYHDKKGYAKIKTNKEKIMYSITKEQLQDIYNDGCTYVKEWFPEVFETKLEVGKWYKNTRNNEMLVFLEEIQDINEAICYGFNLHGKYLNSNKGWGLIDCIEATEQEVKTALENEAVKRGYKQNTHIESINKKYGISMLSCKQSEFKNNTLTIGGCCAFDNGVWATIIPTLTKKEAEEKLGVKII